MLFATPPMKVLKSNLNGYVWLGLGLMPILNQSLGPADTVLWLPISGSHAPGPIQGWDQSHRNHVDRG